MKIAIQGHPARGKEVIQILESLGGKNTKGLEGRVKTFYYIDKGEIRNDLHPTTNYKRYTLREFEKEFPFKIGDEVIFPAKIGWVSGKVTNLTYVDDQLRYEVNSRIYGYCYIEPHKLSLYLMEKARNITLTLDKAKEWYKKGGELKEIALQAFTEKELNPLPRSWKEFCTQYNTIKDDEHYIDVNSNILQVNNMIPNHDRLEIADRNICPSKKSTKAHLAMIQLEQLRNCWWNGWKPEWNNCKKYIIKWDENNLTVLTAERIHAFLVFPTKEMANEFLNCFRDLIEQAGDLI